VKNSQRLNKCEFKESEVNNFNILDHLKILWFCNCRRDLKHQLDLSCCTDYIKVFNHIKVFLDSHYYQYTLSEKKYKQIKLPIFYINDNLFKARIIKLFDINLTLKMNSRDLYFLILEYAEACFGLQEKFDFVKNCLFAGQRFYNKIAISHKCAYMQDIHDFCFRSNFQIVSCLKKITDQLSIISRVYRESDNSYRYIVRFDQITDHHLNSRLN
jgi:hypothetical protein